MTSVNDAPRLSAQLHYERTLRLYADQQLEEALEKCAELEAENRRLKEVISRDEPKEFNQCVKKFESGATVGSIALVSNGFDYPSADFGQHLINETFQKKQKMIAATPTKDLQLSNRQIVVLMNKCDAQRMEILKHADVMDDLEQEITLLKELINKMSSSFDDSCFEIWTSDAWSKLEHDVRTKLEFLQSDLLEETILLFEQFLFKHTNIAKTRCMEKKIVSLEEVYHKLMIKSRKEKANHISQLAEKQEVIDNLRKMKEH